MKLKLMLPAAAILLCTFAIFNVCQGSIPLENISVLVAQGHSTDEKPTIFAVGIALACLILERRAGCLRRSPLAQVLIQVAGVNYELPTIAQVGFLR